MPDHDRRRAALTGSHPRKHKASARGRYRVAATDAIAPGESLKFMLPIRGADEECFVINYEGRFHAYVNRCRHVPMAMDWVDNQFFAEDCNYLMCQTHNAYYEPESGECIAGPPTACGKYLYRVPLQIEGDTIYASAPEQEFED
ncbi:MAG: Rieske 2Fe-2S domain-containing protein [Candidatus Binatus sp.]|uniref:Rieske (2Fe-2S) protein n=1 Tax=Candidatus Binatus sp. TaxID=2811406 RepID=UPI002728379E|nr:Rieske 2Fe-2S domain-containing protein [Candidatus Binatus sp.]MDO8430860.1 Rieske 2Fe-2S domain-containing protein [Candidatus Binatus sp.]